MWIRLKTLAYIYTGNSINGEEKKKKYVGINGYDFIATKDVTFDRTIHYNNGVNIPFDTVFKIAPANKVLLCIEGGSAGKKIAITDRDVCFGNKLACFDSILINDLYLFYIFQSLEFQVLFKSSLTGIIGGVSINTLKEFNIPLPPLEEQQRIVDKINSFEPLLKEYELAEEKLSKLEEEFPEKLKKSILQYAIEGKLVKQDPNDEPASVLLERIKQEKEKLIKEGKIKRNKNESYIYQGDDKNYYENLPPKWEQTTLSKIINLTSGTDLKPEEYSCENIGIPYITGASNITDDNKIIINRYTKNKYINSKLDDILLSCKGTVGKIVINNIGDVHIARQFMGIKSFINIHFLIIYLNTLVTQLNSEAKSIIPGLDRNQILAKRILLPPEKEQLRISNKVQIILNQINN